jgi:hypothetical protein
VSLEPPPPLLAGAPIDVDYDDGLPVHDSQAPAILPVSDNITVSATGTLPALFHFDNSDQQSIQVDVAVLNAYRASPVLWKLLPYVPSAGVYGPVVVQAQTTDTSNNVASASIQVYIRPESPLQDPVCTGGTVAMSGMCLPNVVNDSSSTPSSPPLMRDSRKPWIEVIANGANHKAVLSPSTGLRVVETVVTVGSVYLDAGAAAVDDLDGGVSSRISSYGLKAVNTLEPTQPSQPHLIRYDVRDSAGNAAITKTRRVFVVCPESQNLCQSSNDDDMWYCDPLPGCLLAPTVRPTRTVLPPPEIRLLGEARVEFIQGSAYHQCSSHTPLNDQCDLGAEARDAIEGDLTQYVQACEEGYTFFEYGLQACQYNTSTPGEYTLSFWIRDSATNETVTVSRTVHVLERCEEDESRCADGTCSIGTLCVASSNTIENRQGSTTTNSPTLRLQRIPGQSSADMVAIPFGWSYKACGSSSTPTSTSPCETGLFFAMMLEQISMQ